MRLKDLNLHFESIILEQPSSVVGAQTQNEKDHDVLVIMQKLRKSKESCSVVKHLKQQHLF